MEIGEAYDLNSGNLTNAGSATISGFSRLDKTEARVVHHQFGVLKPK